MLASTSSARAASSVRRAAGGVAPPCRPAPRAAAALARPKQNWRRRAKSARAAAAADDGAADAPSTAKEAIDAGLALFQKGQYAESLALFERAPTLPGTGTKRFRDKPPAASDGERQAAMFNAACAHAKLGSADQGLAALAACLGAGYEDWAQVEGDPDLAPLRADPRFAQLSARYKPRGGGGFLGALFGAKR
jgi:hypothetical protein